jgi:serine phosphatase RsbU (regulator of sigma subunit)
MLKIKRKANIELLQKNKLLDERNSEIETQKNIITEQWQEVENVNKQLISSITYAERIQRAAVSSQADVNKIFPQNFVYYRPRNIVSGDYYRAVRCGRFSVMITADCTGHGIPGAFLSMLGISSLKEFMSKESDAENPGTVLDRMRNFIKTTLVSTSNNSIDDGMDMTICCFDFDNMKLHYAIANQTMVMIRNGKITRLKGDKMPVGRYILEKEHFQTMNLTIEKGDIFYMFSDGIEDQFGGEIINNTGSKLLLRNLETFLLEISSEPIENQKQLLHEKIENWRGNLPQIDDMTMVGIRI